MKTANRMRNSRLAAWRAGVGARAMAGLLALVMTLGLVRFALPEAKAADAKDYGKEQSERKEEYAKKFDQEKLAWSATGTDASGDTVDYGTSARTYLCWATSGSFGGIEHKNYIHVFAFEGETITFGSSEANSVLNIAGTGLLSNSAADRTKVEQQLGADATVDIVLIDLDGNRILYDVTEGGKGHIPDYQTEVLAKTMESVSGNNGTVGETEYTYTPLTYSVHETGVYTFEFHSYDGSGFGGTRPAKNAAFTSKGTLGTAKEDFGGMVDAWDISVFNEQGYKETGRVYADYLDFQENGNVNESYYVLTSDNYIYRWDFKNAHPYTYNFFANNQGLLEKGTDHILYKSVKDVDNGNTYDEFGVTYTYPGTPDTELTKSYKIFFEMPDGDLEGELYNKAVTPDPATNLKFVSQVWDGEKYIPGSYEGRGGWFQFDVENATTATLRIEFKNIDGGKRYAPVEITQVVTPYSTNRFFWDGRDGNGEIIPPGVYEPEDISWTITTKAGEIHFPIVDVEDTTGGFTFTRVSPVYNKDGVRLDADNESNGATTNIYTATKSVIYYDNSAIYYGERVARAGTPEIDIYVDAKNRYDIKDKAEWVDSTWTGGTPTKQNYDADNKDLFFLWRDISYANASEYKAWTAQYRKDNNLRAGDHSHISNGITFYKEDGSLVGKNEISDQQAKITWLDSAKNPVANVGSGTHYGSTYVVSDFSIQNFWTFVPGQPVTADGDSFGNITIKKLDDGQAVANITGLVFYDNDGGKTSGFDGKYNAKQTDMDVPLSGVTVNLYRQTADEVRNSEKTYCTVTGDHGNWIIQNYTGGSPATDSAYELVKPAATTDLTGHVIFENQLYDAEKGTKFIYEVKKTYPNWELTSKNQTAAVLGASSSYPYGNYALYAYDSKEKGTEVQVFTLGTGADMVDPEKNLANYENHTATAIDVGYHYTPVQSLRAIKSWNVTGTGTKAPDNVVYELSYYDKTEKKTEVYEERSLSSIMSWENIWNYLPDTISSHPVEYFISAEYYLMPGADGGGTLYKHTFELDDTASALTYKSFVGTAYSRELSKEEVAALDYGSKTSLNGEVDEWEKASAPFTAVLDRNVGTAETTVTITNSNEPGVIEVLKYTGSEEDHNYLSGATFRLYTNSGSGGDITLEQVKKLIDEGKTAGLAALQVDSGSTRDNGRMTFAGLDPEKHYVIREMYPPAGYRAREVLYIVHPASCKTAGNDHYYEEQPEGMEADAWDTWQLQNLYFGEDDRAEAHIANIPASGDMAIRKQIEGRAWGDGDSFSFDVAFRNTAGKPLAIDAGSGVTLEESGTNRVIEGSTAVRIPQTEYDLFADDSGVNSLDGKLTEFLAAFNKTDNTADLTINNTSATAEDTVSVHGMQDVKVSLPDTKQSVGLIVNGTIDYDADGNPTTAHPDDALMNTSESGGGDSGTQAPTPHNFPAAGTYTFTVSENHPSETGTTDYTYRVYTITVVVTRVLDPDEESGTTATRDNSYLRAEVQSIYYQELSGSAGTTYPENYGSRMYYAGVAPTFTNTYHVQPAVQTTSYAIQVDFSGRLDNNGQPINQGKNTENWLDTDSFTVSITGDDEATQNALANGDIHIGGLLRDEENSPAQKKLQFNQIKVVNANNNKVTDDGPYKNSETGKWEHLFKFEDLNFQNIVFPVKWVFSEAANIGGVTYEEGAEVPETTEDGENMVIQITEEEAGTLGIEAGNYLLEDATYRDELSGHTGLLHPVESRTEDVVYNLTVKEEVPEETRGITYDPVSYSMRFTLKDTVSGAAGSDANGVIEEMDLVVSKTVGDEVTERYATCETDQQVVDTFDKWTHPETLLGSPEDGEEAKYLQYYINSDHVIREVERKTAADGPHYYVTFGTSQYEVVEGWHELDEANKKIGFQDLLKTYTVTFIVKKEAHSGNHTLVFNNEYKTQGTWTPTIHKFVEGRDWGDDETFDFELACTAWPGMETPETKNTYNPLKNEDGTVSAKTLTIEKDTDGKNDNTGSFGAVTFNAPGTYQFTLSETINLHTNGKLEIRDAIPITVTASDEEHNGKLKLTVTGLGGSADHLDTSTENNTDNVASTINFVNAYSESGDFDIAIEKTLTGRDWTAEDSFPFTVKLDKAAQDAVTEGHLTMPTTPGWNKVSDEEYTVTVTNDSTGASSDAARRVLGTLNLSELRAKGGTYRFTVTEDTGDFTDKALECRQPTVKLTVNAYSGESTEGGYTGAILTYAYFDEDVKDKDDEDALKPPYVIPFTNRFYVDTKGPGAEEEGTNFTVAKSFTGRPEDKWKGTDTFHATVAFSGTDEQLEKFQFKNDAGEYVKWDGAQYGGVTFTDANRSEAFDFRFFEAGAYEFTVSETKGEIAGVTYDESKYIVTFTVAPDPDNGNRLTVTRAITGGVAANVDGGTITLKNTYQATGAWTPTVTKELKGRDWQEGETFAFTLSCDKTDGVELPGKTEISVGKDDATTGVSFGAVKFTKPGEYTFTIAESGKGVGKLTTDPAITLTVEAKDNGDGKMNLEVTGEGGTTTEDGSNDVKTTVKFVNTYNESGEFPLSLSKLLTGRDWEIGETFRFTITPDGATQRAITEEKLVTVPTGWGAPADGKYTVAVSQAASGETGPAGWETKTLELGQLRVGNLGGMSATYTFVIEEDTSDFEAQSLYCAQPKIKLTVTASGDFSGALKFSATYAYLVDGEETGAVTPEGQLVLPFTNRFYVETLDPGTGEGSAGFTVQKSLTGRPDNAWAIGDEFTARVAFDGENSTGRSENFQFDHGSGYVPWDDAAYGEVTFTDADRSEAFDFRFFEVGTYTFTVTEENGGKVIDGITYDGNTYTVTFTVTKSGVGNRLAVTRAIQRNGRALGGGAITLQNTYAASGTWTPVVTKELQGRDWQAGETFAFRLSCREVDGVELPASPSVEVGEAEAADGVPFDPVTFTEPGTYHFTIAELGTGAGLGLGHSGETPASITLTVDAADGGNGALALTVTGADSTRPTTPGDDSAVESTVHFVNAYSEEGDFALAIQKRLTGRDWDSGETFTFTIAPDEPTKAALDEGGPITAPAAWGSPDGDGNYTVQVGGADDTAAIDGDGWTSKTHSLDTLALGNHGAKRATYLFHVREDTSDFAGKNLYSVQPDIQLTLVVDPFQNAGGIYTGALLTYAYLDGPGLHGDMDPVEGLTLPFTNCYYADTGALGAGFQVNASLTGRPGGTWLDDDAFHATVTFAGDSGLLANVHLWNEAADDYEAFSPQGLTFTSPDQLERFDFRFLAEGVYPFTVTEAGDGAPGVTYDGHTYTVTFTVTADPDNGNRLTVTRAIQRDGTPLDGDTITLQNTYAAAGTWTPVVTKDLRGRDWQAGEVFQFTLACEETDGVELPASLSVEVGEAEAEGGVSFGSTRFTRPGVYHFTITEAAPGAGITAEAGEIGLIVTAVDQGDGALSLTVTGTDGAEPAALAEERDDVVTTVCFVNAYSESGDFPLSLAKRLTGRDWSGTDAFSFTLAPRDAVTEAAIAAGTLTVPEGWISPSGAGYAVTLHGTAGGGETQSLDLGTFHVGNLRGGAAAYTFTVQEDTAAFEEADLYCAQPEIRLTLHANGQELDGALKFSATYAYIVDGEEADPGAAGDALTLPFTNRYYADTRASDAGFQVNVSLTGRPGDVWLDSDRFQTTVAFAGSRDLLANVHLWDGEIGGYASFGPQQRAFTSPDQVERFDFRFLAEGDYPFTVTQGRGSIPGVRYDATAYTVTFHVARTGGRLTVTRSVAPQSATRAAGDGAITFRNTYSATGSWTPTVTKRLQGRPWQTDEAFQFTLTCAEAPVGAASPLPAPATVSVGEAAGETGVSFSPVHFTQPGTYRFTIAETGSGAGLGTGEERAHGVIALDVTAEDDTEGHLVLLVTGAGGASPIAPSSVASTKVAFVNTYDEGGQFRLALSKLLTGRPWNDGEAFSFTIAPDDLTRAAIGADGPVAVPAAWGSPDGDGNYTVQVGEGDAAATRDGWTAKTHDLGTLTVGNLGGDGQRYSFTVTEDTSAFGGDLYCRQPSIQLTVTATRNTETGAHAFTAVYAYLDDSVTHGGTAPVEGVTLPFTNHAAAQPDPEATGSSLTVGKALVGRDWLAGERYAVELRLTGGEMEQVRYSGDGGEYLALPASLTHTFQSADGSAPEDWTLDLRFYAEGDYVFTAREIQPDQPPAGIACDPATYTVTFHVTRTAGGGGKLVARRTIASAPAGDAADQVLFVNRYTPLAATWTPSVTKVLNGRSWAANDSFTFDLALAGDSPDTEGVSLPADHAVAVTSADQVAAFPPVTFSRAGTYRFTLRETNLGFDADAGAYPITVTVTNDAASGKLSLSFAPEGVTASGEETAEGWRYATTTEFVNTFSQQPSQFTLGIQKTLSGRAWLTDDVFSFTITPDEATQAALADVPAALELPAAWGEADLTTGAYTVALSNRDAAAVDEVLTAALGTVHVNRTGLYRFTIEEAASAAGDTYCPEPAIRLTVTAMPETDPNGVPNGYMVVTTFAHAEGGGSLIQDPASGVTTIPFTNHACDEIALTLNKTYTDVTDGNDKAWADGFFQAQVTLERADGPVSCGGVPLAAGHAVTIPLTPDGAEVPLRFLGEGDYELTVAEVPGAAPGVTYDPTRFTVAATVTADPVTGQLAADYTLNGERANQITFANTYRETPITGGLTVTKTVLGEDPGARFRFTVTLSDAAVHGVYDGMAFQDGVAEFTLGDGEAVSASGLPAGVNYTVAEEETAGYTAAAVGAAGRIPASGSVTAAFTNARSTEPIPPTDERLGSLTVTKTVSGDTAEPDRAWHFTVTLGDPALTGTYGGMTFTGGVAHVTLTGGHSVTATGLPAGLSYTVVETEAGQDGYTTSSSNGRGTIPGGGVATASFINHRDTEPAAPTGGLSVSKTVSGALGDQAARWHFTVTLSGDGAERVSGAYGGVTFRNGVADLTLGHGESQTIPGLPAGLNYEVTEREAGQDGYTTSATAATGTIQRDRTAAAVFTNVKNPAPQAGHGHLTVVKTVTGNGGERDRAFPFTITLSEPRTGVYDGVTFQDGVGVFSLESGQSVTLELPLGTTYTVTEEEAEGYTASSTGWAGIILDAPAVASFVNDRQLSVGDLTISKTVTGSAGDKSREWHFHLALGDQSIDGVYGDMTFKNGMAEFTLKSGQSKTAMGLPAGVTYTVTEVEAGQDGYKTTSTGATGAIPHDGAASAAFVNAKPAVATGSSGQTAPHASNETPVPSETPTPSETPVPEEPPTPSETPVPSEPPASSETPAPGETPVPSETPAPEEPPTPSETPVPEEPPTPDETPKTGDDSHLGLWVALLLLGAAGTAVALWPTPWHGKGRRGRK